MTENTGYRLQGAADNSGAPEFLTTGHMVSGYVDRLLESVQADLVVADKEVYIRGLDDVLVSDPLNREVTTQVGERRAINGSQIMQSPTPEAVDGIIARAIDEVRGQVPGEYQEGAIAQLEGLRPKYAKDVAEAAAALGITLPETARE